MTNHDKLEEHCLDCGTALPTETYCMNNRPTHNRPHLPEPMGGEWEEKLAMNIVFQIGDYLGERLPKEMRSMWADARQATNDKAIDFVKSLLHAEREKLLAWVRDENNWHEHQPDATITVNDLEALLETNEK